MKRIVFFIHYDPHNLVDPYVEYYLAALKKQTNEMVIISNSQIDQENRDKLLCYTPHVLVRENREFDFGAWREGLNQYGWNNLKAFDELLLVNDSCYGPVSGSFAPMFTTMDQQSCDFWGITSYNGSNRRYIQSYFLAFRKIVVCSDTFRNFMQKYHGATSRDVVINSEHVLTKILNKAGFRDTCYRSTLKTTQVFLEKDKNIAFLAPQHLLENGGLLFKKKILQRLGVHPEIRQAAIDYIKQHDPVMEKLIRSHARRTFSANNQIDSFTKLVLLNNNISGKVQKQYNKIAVHLHLCHEDMKKEFSHYLANIPYSFDLLITLPSHGNNTLIKAYFQSHTSSASSITVKKISERDGRIFPLTILFEKEIQHYDLVCHIHSIKTLPSNNVKIWKKYLFDNLMGDKKTVENILHAFSTNEELGILFPPMYSPLLSNHRNTWKNSREKYYYLRQKLINNHYLMPEEDEHYPPLMPSGGMFWFRPQALTPIFKCTSLYETLEGESIPVDELGHIITQLLVPVCLSQGYDFCYALKEDYLIRNYLDVEKYFYQCQIKGIKQSFRMLLIAVKQLCQARYKDLFRR